MRPCVSPRWLGRRLRARVGAEPGGIAVPGWDRRPGVGSLSRGGITVLGWDRCPGVGSLSWGGITVPGWDCCPGVGSLSRGGITVPGWDRRPGVGLPSRRGGQRRCGELVRAGGTGAAGIAGVETRRRAGQESSAAMSSPSSASLTKPDLSLRGHARLRLRALGSQCVLSLRLPGPSQAG